MVLAGGFGTRVQHLLPGVPKPMASVAGKPFLEWVIRYLARQGVRKAIISTGYLADVVAKHFDAHPVPEISTRCVKETSPLGTAGGFLHAARLSGESPEAWLVLNGDSLALAGLAGVAALLAAPSTSGVIVGCSVPDASRYGTLASGPGGDLLGFEEKRPGEGIINAGIYLLKASLMDRFPAKLPLSFEKEVFPQFLQQGAALRVCPVNAPFLDIGTPETLRQAEGFVEAHKSRFLL